MKDHAIANNIRSIAMPKIACGLDKMIWEGFQNHCRFIPTFWNYYICLCFGTRKQGNACP